MTMTLRSPWRSIWLYLAFGVLLGGYGAVFWVLLKL